MEENNNIEQTPLEKLVLDFFNNRISDIELEREVSELYAKHSNSESIGKNLRSFDLQKAREGKPVCTRDGRKARIISCSLRNKNFPIAAIVEDEEENVYQFEANGVCDEHDENLDLMMLHEKKYGWINIIKTEDGVYCCKGELHSDYNDAFIENINVLDNRGITVKIEWEE